MRRWFIIAAVAAQVGVLAYMAGVREWVLVTGEQVLVRTAPIDPNDPMRGEYARFSYEISTVPRELCRDGVAGWFDDVPRHSREFRDRRVYAELERDATGVVHVASLTDRKPTGGLFIRGRTEWIDTRFVRVRYGIEAFFMEQGQALAFEMKARDEMVGVPVNAVVAISRDGLAVLRDYAWESLGMHVQWLRRDTPADSADGPGRERRGIIGAVVTLKNHGDVPVALIDLPEGRSFQLVVAAELGAGDYEPVERADPSRPSADDVVLLPPGGTHEITLDLTGPEWALRKVVRDPSSADDQIPVTLEALDQNWGTWLRLEYRPPERELCAGLPHADRIRHAALRSRAFSPAGGVD